MTIQIYNYSIVYLRTNQRISPIRTEPSVSDAVLTRGLEWIMNNPRTDQTHAQQHTRQNKSEYVRHK